MATILYCQNFSQVACLDIATKEKLARKVRLLFGLLRKSVTMCLTKSAKPKILAIPFFLIGNINVLVRLSLAKKQTHPYISNILD